MGIQHTQSFLITFLLLSISNGVQGLKSSDLIRSRRAKLLLDKSSASRSQALSSEQLGLQKHEQSTSPVACLHTIQGRILVADNKGFVCSRASLNFTSGCCPTSDQPFPCHSCNNSHSHCCREYEFCVACCLHPERTPLKVALSSPRAKHMDSGTFSTVFEYCQDRCRHNSKSVVHENAYASKYHHCYSVQQDTGHSEPSDSSILWPGITVVQGLRGQSCDTACESKKLTCHVDSIKALNDCTMMKRFLPCKEGCIPSMGPDQPAMVADNAPENEHPGACLFSTLPDYFSCNGCHENTHRLCPCLL